MPKESTYRVEYYQDKHSKKALVQEYIDALNIGYQKKIFSYINKLIEEHGCLKFPYAEHIENKIWQLRPDVYRVFYFIFTGKRIILLHIYRKKSNRTPRIETNRALDNYKNFMNS